MFIPALRAAPKDYHVVATQAADLLNRRAAEGFAEAEADGHTVDDLDVGTLAQIAQVNFLAAIAQSLKK